MAIKRRKFRFEELESRKMRAADITLGAGIVEITGTEGADVAEVRFHEDHVHVELTYPDDDGEGTDDITRQYDIGDVSQIRFEGGAGGDEMTMIVDDLDDDVSLNHLRAYFYGEGDNDTFDNQTSVPTYAYGGAGNDTLLGGSNWDFLFGDQGDDDLDGRTGNDYYYFSGANLGRDEIFEAAGQGTDTISLNGLTLTNNTSWDNTFLDLSATYEQYVYYAQNGEHFRLTIHDPQSMENVYGTQEHDYLYGNGQNNNFYGYNGDDVFRGRGGNDLLYGHNGNDWLWGEQGADTLSGGNDQDILLGDEYNYELQDAFLAAQDASGQIDVFTLVNELETQFGVASYQSLDDALHSQLATAENVSQFGGSDTLDGGYGVDLAYGGSGGDIVRGGGDDDVAIGGGGDDDLHGDFAYNSTYRQGVDFLFGLAGDDDLFGRGGDDWLFGGDGLDDLEGNDGNDLLYGRQDGQADDLNGGAGTDRFVRYYYNGGGYGWTHLAEENEEDYVRGEDVLGYVYL